MLLSLDDKASDKLRKLYGDDDTIVEKQLERYTMSIEKFKKLFKSGGKGISLFSTPGRTEISGNHTDHNLGKVLAGGVNLDSIAVVEPNDENVIILYSKGYEGAFKIELNTLKPIEEEEGTTNALMRGIAARFVQLGYNIGGFNAYINSDVMPGSGLSSSASIEVLLGTILSYLYNDGKVSPQMLAKIGQYAENEFFGKPCGLMDQMACAVGGFVAIDFKDLGEPIVEKIDFDIERHGYNLLVVETGGDHSDLTEDYAAIPREMKSVAEAMGGSVCREFSMDDLIGNAPKLRQSLGDRAILRAMHFFEENDRVDRQIKALKEGDFIKFLKLVNKSGDSSWKWLQNCYTLHTPKEQGITLALALTELFIKQNGGEGASRVHGGGFAGTIQVFLPKKLTDCYIDMIESVLGAGAVTILNIRKYGTVCLI